MLFGLVIFLRCSFEAFGQSDHSAFWFFNACRCLTFFTGSQQNDWLKYFWCSGLVFDRFGLAMSNELIKTIDGVHLLIIRNIEWHILRDVWSAVSNKTLRLLRWWSLLISWCCYLCHRLRPTCQCTCLIGSLPLILESCQIKPLWVPSKLEFQVLCTHLIVLHDFYIRMLNKFGL